MIRKPIYKLGKRLGVGIHEKCQTQKFALSEARVKKAFKHRRNVSDYGRQLLEKQKVRFAYGITEKQFRKYIKLSMRELDKVLALYRQLEMRLDNTAYSLGLAPTRRAARQMVSHGHLMVNGRKVTVPSYTVKIGDKISIREGSRTKTIFTAISDYLSKHNAPKWLIFNYKKMEGEVKAVPEYEPDVSLFDFKAVFEFYSR